MSTDKQPSRNQVIAEVIGELQGPTPLETVVDRVLARKPSRAKDPRGPIRNEIRLWAFSLGVVFADSERKVVVPVNVAMRGLRFRHLVTDQEVSSRQVLWGDSDAIYLPGEHWPPSFVGTDVELLDANGAVLGGKATVHVEQVETVFGKRDFEVAARKLPAFFHQHHVAAGDSLLFTVEQFAPPRWRIEHEPRAQRDQAAIDRRNRELMDSLFAMLEAAPREFVDEKSAVRSALCQLADPHGYPGDPWLDAMEADGRMGLDYSGIVYADSLRSPSFTYEPDPFIVLDGEAGGTAELEEPPLPPLPEAAARRVYTFKVGPVHRKQLWRRIELAGDFFLADLNRYLVKLFKHDWDHMGAFLKLVRRGSKRVREVEIALVDPLGRGEGSELRIAELELAAGDALKWIFDFGEMFEYRLQLESVDDPPPAASARDYPRVVGANEPQLLYCTACQAKGKQVVAKWVCWDCSQPGESLYMLCEACSRRPKHEEHFLEEWVY